MLQAIDLLVEALRSNTRRNQEAIRRAAAIRKQRERGVSYREIVTAEGKARLVELTRENLLALAEHGGRLRRAEATALHKEGMTMEEIARLFGVTRQRVSALLKEANNRAPNDSHQGDSGEFTIRRVDR